MMATMLETYQEQKSKFDNSIQTVAPDPEQVWRQQEILYRIEVLETCQMFVKSAPDSVDIKPLVTHYQMVDAFVQNLTLERRYGVNSGDEAKKQCDTAYGSLIQVIEGYRKGFGSFAPGNDSGCYRKAIAGVIQTVLPVWIQYRQTYTEIKKEADR